MKNLSAFVESLFDGDFDVDIDDIVFDRFAKWMAKGVFSSTDKYIKEIQPRLMDFIKSFPQIDEATALNSKKTPYCCKVESFNPNPSSVSFTFIDRNKTMVYINDRGLIRSEKFGSRNKFINDLPTSWKTIGIFKITPGVFDKVLWLLDVAHKSKN